MSHKIQQPARFAGNGGRMAALIDVRISQLKRELEERLSRSQATGHWQEMIEDCDLILHQLDKRQCQADELKAGGIVPISNAQGAKDDAMRLGR